MFHFSPRSWEKVSRVRVGTLLVDSLGRLRRDKTLRRLWPFFDERPAPPGAVFRYAARMMSEAAQRDPPERPFWGWYGCGEWADFEDNAEAALRAFNNDWMRCRRCGAPPVALLRAWDLVAFRASEGRGGRPSS